MTAAEAFLTLMSKDGFTSEQRSQMAMKLAQLLFDSPAGTQQSCVERLERLALLPDAAKAHGAFVALAILTSNLQSLASLTRAAAPGLLSGYEKVVASGYERDANFQSFLKRMAAAK